MSIPPCAAREARVLAPACVGGKREGGGKGAPAHGERRKKKVVGKKGVKAGGGKHAETKQKRGAEGKCSREGRMVHKHAQ